MKSEQKRLFVGNLPSTSTEELLIKKFKKYGKVLSVELKRRADGSTFAFMDLEINPTNLVSCLDKVPRKSWDGHNIKIELAKESFLSRLERERESAKKKSIASPVKEEQVLSERPSEKKKSIARPVKKEHELSVIPSSKKKSIVSPVKKEHVLLESPCDVKKENKKGSVTIHNNNNISLSESSEEDADVEEKRKGNIPMFRGVLSMIKDEPESKPDDQTSIINHAELEIERDMMKKFESFSDFWKDSGDETHVSGGETFVTKRKVNKDIPRNPVELSNRYSSPKDASKEADQYKKNLIAEERRLKSIAERKKLFLQQKQAVKTALRKIDSTSRNSKKIVFDGEDNEEAMDPRNSEETRIVQNSFEAVGNLSSTKKGKLFSDDESEDEANDFKIKSQFEGQKGQKLLELQARYANDKRFTLDERFYESDDDTDVKQNDKPDDVLDEKKNQLRILGSILGQELHPQEEKNAKQKRKSMLRFDPTKPDHVKYEVKKSVDDSVSQLQNNDLMDEKVSAKKIKKEKTETLMKNDPVPEVSKDKYYEVSDSLKESLKNRSEGFSLLNMFGSNDSESKDDEYKNIDHKEKGKKKMGWDLNPFKYDSSESEDEEQNFIPADKSQIEHHEAWHESFFFAPNDTRLKEGVQFLKKKVDNEDNFAAKRRELKQIIRYKIKNNLKKKLVWKKKLGGRKQSKIHPKKNKHRLK